MKPWRVPILMLHHVEPEPRVPPPVHRGSYLTPEQFGRLLDRLEGRGSRTLTLAQVAGAWRAGRRLPRRSVVLTFDDGCRCFAEHALPALAERGMTATLFAVSGLLGATNRWDRERRRKGEPEEREERLLDSEGLRRVAAAGIEIGSHSRTHARLPECTEAELAVEVAGSKADLEAALGRPVATFCYPWGRSGPAVREAVAAAGYLAAVGIDDHPGSTAGDPLGLPRLSVLPTDSRFELWLKASGLYPWWAKLPRLGVLSGLRRLG